MEIFNGIAALEAAVGRHLGYSQWFPITQERVDAFADATLDHQWIHVDPVRAAEGPFGTTIAHGYLTLSLLAKFVSEIYTIDGVRMAVNYGANKLRFPSPVPVGSSLRGGVELLSVTPSPAGYQVVSRVTIECDQSDKPACVVEAVVLVVP